MANTIKIKRGLSSNIDNITLEQGELAITTDTNELYVGTESGKTKLNGSNAVLIYDTDNEETVRTKLSEAVDGPTLTGEASKFKKDCFYITNSGSDTLKIYKLIHLSSPVVDTPFNAATFSNGTSYIEITLDYLSQPMTKREYGLSNLEDGEGSSSLCMTLCNAPSPCSFAEGISTLTGSKAVRAISGDSSTKTYILENVPYNDITLGLTCKLVDMYEYPGDLDVTSGFKDLGTINAYDKQNKTITVSNYVELDELDYHLMVIGDGTEFGTYYLGTADYSHAEGVDTITTNKHAHAEGCNTKALGEASHAEGCNTKAYSTNSHVEGYKTETGRKAFLITNQTKDIPNKVYTFTLSSVEGLEVGQKFGVICTDDYDVWKNGAKITEINSTNKIVTVSVPLDDISEHEADAYFYLVDYNLGDRYIPVPNISGSKFSTASHAEGSYTTASGTAAHAEGNITKALGEYSHAEGAGSIASGEYSHAEGGGTKASAMGAHAEGQETTASGDCQHVQGKYNIEDITSAHIIGNGSSLKKSNAHTIDWSGNAWFAGDVYTGSTSGTNKDEGSKILATKEYVDSKTSANYTYDKVVYVMPASEITTTTGTAAFTQDSEARTFTAVGAINGEDPVTYENVITLTADVKNILIYSVGSLIGDMGPADQIAQISITDISGTTSQILNTRGCSENLINTGPLTSGSKLTLTYTSGTYEPSNAQQVFTLEYYTETVTDASLQDFISSKVTHESTDRRQMDMILQKNIDAQYSDLQTQIFDLQGHVIENMLDAVIYRLSSIDNNSEFRFFGPSNSGVTDLGLSFEDISLTSGDKFEMSATFQTASSGCTFEITESTSVKVKLTGDDVTNGVLNPVANKVYEIAFYWNGFFMSGVVRGVDHEAAKVQNKITITNTTSTDATYSSELVVGPNEDLYNNKLATLTPGQSQEFTIDGNLIYVGSASSSRYSTSIDGNPSGCTVNWEKRGDFYYVYEIEITSSPASCSIRYT